MHLEDLRSGARVESVNSTCTEATLAEPYGAVARLAPTPAGRSRPRGGLSEAYVVDEGDRQTAIHLEHYDYLNKIPACDEGETQIPSLGAAPIAVRIKDTGVTLGSALDVKEATGDSVARGRAQTKMVPPMIAVKHASMPAPPVVTGSDTAFKVVFTLNLPLPLGPITTITLLRSYSFGVAVACWGAGLPGGKLQVDVVGNQVVLLFGEALPLPPGAYSINVILHEVVT